MSLHGLHTQLTRLWPHRRKTAIAGTNEGAVLWGGEIILFSHSSITRGTPDDEYDLRFEADEEHMRELIDRIDRMSLREAEK